MNSLGGEFSPGVSTPGDQAQSPSRLFAWTMVAILMLAHVCSFIDRTILNLLAEPIRKDLGLSDVQTSILLGPAFAFFFAFAALPIGRLVDRLGRLRIAWVSLILWTLMTIAGGFTRTFPQLLAARIGVASGEAGLHPAAHSLISDSFPQVRRSRAMGVYVVGAYVGAGLALIFGGKIVALAQAAHLSPWAAQFKPWQLALMIVSLPGFVVAVALTLLPEPARRERLKASSAGPIPLGEALAFLKLNQQAYYSAVFGISMMALVSYSFAAWSPAFLARQFHWDIARVGWSLGAYGIPFAIAGLLGAGWISDWMSERGILDGKFIVLGICATVGAPAMLISYFATTPEMFLVSYMLMSFLAATALGVGPAAIQEMAPNELRGQASGLYSLIMTIISLGLGPPAVAFVSQELLHGRQPLNVVMAGISIGAFAIAAVLFWTGRRAFRETRQRRIAALAAGL
jgi:MFS family permease